MSTQQDDPGWPGIGAIALASGLTFVPFVGRRIIRRIEATSGLVTIRLLYVRLLTVPFVLLVVLRFLGGGAPFASAHPGAIAAVTASGVVSALLVRYARRRVLVPTNAEILAGSYRAIFFISLSLAEAALMAGFVAFFLTDSDLGVYLIGMAFCLWGLWRIAPSRSDIARRQLEIAAQGSSLSLVGALDLLSDRSRPSPADPRA